MAVEIKSVDVKNEQESATIEIMQWFGWTLKSSQRVYNKSSTPRGAITHDNVTYIHSETETVDFTKLVFERDKKLLHYNELVALEKEFFSLSEQFSELPPYMPPNVHTMEDWAKHFEPDLRTNDDKKKIHLRYGISMGIFVFGGLIAGAVLGASDIVGSFLAWLIIGSASIIGWLWYKKLKKQKAKALKLALTSEKSIYHTRLKDLYQETIDRIDAYEKGRQRMEQIRDLACSLLEN